MSWFLRGVQSAIFHYASCAPCTGYNDGRRRRREAKAARKARERLVREQPETYYHPEPTGTNPYWDEEIALGPGPPPRRNRRTNTGSTRGRAGALGPVASQQGSSIDDDQRLSDDTLDDDTWNLKRYQREDEQLWGLDDAPTGGHPSGSASSSSAIGTMLGLRTSRPPPSRADSYYSARAPPVNDLHPPVVSLPAPDVADNRWMLQPPPKASVMAGRERATHRSRSGSGASSRVELSMHRHLRRNRSRTPQARAPSSASSRKRRDTPVLARTDTADSQASHLTPTASHLTPTASRTVSVRQSRPALSTVVSSGSGPDENALPLPTYPHAARSSDSLPAPRLDARHLDAPCLDAPHSRQPFDSSDLSSLNCLQDTVSPRALLTSRFVSAPLVEAKIRLPPSQTDLAADAENTEHGRAPFDSRGYRDPGLRWSVDF